MATTKQKTTTKKTTKKKAVKKTAKKAVKKTVKKAVKKVAPAVKKTAKKKDDSRVILRIRVKAYENKILDVSVKQITDTALRYDATIVGPVPLPTEIKKYTVNRASFVYKDSREQFEIRVHKRLIDIINPDAKTIEALTNLSLPSGVHIDVKMV